jgi:hypothetical protein
MKRSIFSMAGAVFIIGVVVIALAACGPRPGASLGPNFVGLAKAPELPVANPDIVGIFERREDNSVYVGINILKFERIRECYDCPAHKNIAYNGPLVEVVVTRDTVLYADITSFDAPVIDGKVQQALEPGTLDDIGPEALVQVWGEQQGDRLLARVLVYDYLPD